MPLPRPTTIVRVFATVLGIDPGLTRCGYAVLRAEGNAVKPLALGVLTTPASMPLPQRLASVKADLVALLHEFRADGVAVEQVFFQNNVRTAMSVGQASGLALVEALDAGCEVAQYSPNQVKDAIAGRALLLVNDRVDVALAKR